MTACYTHLEATQDTKPYYSKVNDDAFDKAKHDINMLLEEGIDHEFLTPNEFKAMKPDEKSPSRFYCNFKVHKTYEIVPPVRPIVSGSGSITENTGKFVAHHLSEVSTKHDSYLKDTPDFIRKIEKLNVKGLPKNTLIVTMDVSGLFTNIPKEEGLESARATLDEREKQDIPSGYIVRLLEVILENNIFEFNQENFTQNIGTGMGQPPAPPYADSFMAKKIDPIIKMLLKQFSDINIESNEFLKRFLDDIIMMFVGTTKKLHQMFELINKIHPNIKFTMAHTSNKDEKESESCNCPKTDSVPFLDTLCTIREGKVILDLYKKPTGRNQYLLTSSCHPAHCVENIPFSLALRINRICTDISQRDIRHHELKEMLFIRKRISRRLGYLCNNKGKDNIKVSSP